jgi:Clp amino terminal domain, pathogenicity island component
MLGKELEATIRRALAYANERRQEYSSIEHLLLALLDDPNARKVFLTLGVDTEGLRSEVAAFLDQEKAEAVDGLAAAKLTVGFQRTIQRAIVLSKAYARSANGANALVALFSERGSPAANLLADRGMTRRDVVQVALDGKVHRGPEPASIAEVLEATRPQMGLRFEMQTATGDPTLEDAQELLEVIRVDVNWAWRVSEAIARFIKRDTSPGWVGETMAGLRRLADGSESDVRPSMPDFAPAGPTLLARPVIHFEDAQCYDSVQALVIVKAAPSTQIVMSGMWSLRTWGRGRSAEELAEAKVELVQKIAQCVKYSDAQQQQTVETLIVGLLNAPNGMHARGEAVVLSLPHLL